MDHQPTCRLTLRPAQRADGVRIAELFAQLGYEAHLPHLEQQLCGAAETVLALADGAIVGVLVMHMFTPLHVARPWAVISALVVDANVRSQGAGAALVAHAQQLALAHNCAHLELACSETRTEAHRFYLAQGFQEVRKRFVKRF